jgi:hypothetical protein
MPLSVNLILVRHPDPIRTSMTRRPARGRVRGMMTGGRWSLTLAASAFGALLTGQLTAFGEPGHRVVGHVAESHLAGSRARAEVRRILRAGETLADAGQWPDTIRDAAYEDDDTARFRLGHPGHDTYHFTNVPFHATRYQPGAIGTHPTDIVTTARESIRVLRGQSSFFTEREALRMLAHLVCDIHQPLHVGNAFVAADGPLRFVVPEGSTGWRSTHGGNALRYGPKDTFNLHSYWDAHAVTLAMRKQDVRTYAAHLVKERGTPASWRNTGDVESWPVQWADEALVHAKEAYAQVDLLQHLVPDEGGRTAHRWRIRQRPGYDTLARKIVPAQLAKAGYRLAETLRAIWPD